jgi:subtilisin family serine protease
MPAPLWNRCGLLFVGLLGVGVVVCASAAAQAKDKPPAKRVVQPHPRAAPRLPAMARRPLPQQNLGRRVGPPNNQQPGSGVANVGRPPLGPQMRNPAGAAALSRLPNGAALSRIPNDGGPSHGPNGAALSRVPNGAGLGLQPRQAMTPPGLRTGLARTPNMGRPSSGLPAGQSRFGRFDGNANTRFGSNGNGRFGGNGNARFGSLANRTRGGNGAPPGTRLIDMRVMPLPPGTGLPPIGEARFRTNELVLQFGGDRTPQDVAALARRFGLTIAAQQTIGALRRTVYTFRINNGQPVTDVIRQIDGAGVNASAQPNYTYGLTQLASTGQGVDQDAAAEHGDATQYVVAKLHLGAAHRITKGDDVIIALIDSRVDTKQPDFAGQIVDSYDAGCGTNAPPDPHGTGMAGAIASHSGLVGVAPDAKIMAICAFGGSSGATPQATSANIIRGVDYAIEHGAKIINMSFAGPQDPALAQELQVAREKGILIVAAAGNAGATSPPLYPGADPNVIAVTATDEHDRLFNGANQGSYVAVAAPGVNVLVPAPEGGVQVTTGTSVATAHVSGVAALLVAEEPSRTPEDIRAILVDTAKHLGTEGVNPQFGAGLVNPLKALRSPPEVVSQTSAPAPAAAPAPASR